MIKKYLIMLTTFGGIAHQLHADKAYVGNQSGNSVSIFNTANNTVSGTVIDTGSTIVKPSYIAFTPDGTTAYVSNDRFPGLDSISIVNVANNTVSGVVQNMSAASFSSIEALGITPDGTKMYAVAFSQNAVGIVTLNNNTYTANVTASVTFPFRGPSSIAITPDGTKAYVTNATAINLLGKNTVSVIKVADDAVTKYVTDTGSTFNRPLVVTMSPDGKTAYVCNFETVSPNGTVSIINVETDAVTGTISAPSIDEPIDLIVSPDGTTLYILNRAFASTNPGVITVWDIANSAVITTIPKNNPSNFSDYFAFASNGKNLYMTNRTPDTVSIINAETNTITGDVIDSSPVTFKDPYAIAITPAMAATPGSASGSQVANTFLTQTEFVNVLNWTASSGSPVSYAIYRDEALTDLAGSVSANTLTFQDHDRTANTTYTYYIVSVDQYDAVSHPAVVTVKPV